jgi:NAD(P)H-hydrate epimerase
MKTPLLTADEAKAADGLASSRFHIDSAALMEQAAAAVVHALERHYGHRLDHVPGLVLAGTGNNGGDALAVARLLLARDRSAPLRIVVVGDRSTATEGFRRHVASLEALEAELADAVETAFLGTEGFVVDGLFGIGLTRPVTGAARSAIEAVNARARGTFAVAVDVPSGLCANTGRVLGTAIRADRTITLGFAKRGLFTGDAADCVGAVTVAPIGIPRQAAPSTPSSWRIDGPVPPAFSRRRATSHKGDYGFVECLLGDRTMHGAAILAATAALRTGAGRAAIRGAPEDLALVAERVPADLMLRPLPASFPSTTVVVAGPGWGCAATMERCLDGLLEGDHPLVLDADALAMLPARAERVRARRAGTTVLLPHPKEAATLLGESAVDAVERDRFAAVRALAERYGAVAVLKGRGTLLSAPGTPVFVIDRGSPALAKGGTGDVLAGIVAALWASGADALAAATNGVWLHGYLGERWEARGASARALLASDLVATLPEALAEIERGWA